jgi:hypothetical protein
MIEERKSGYRYFTTLDAGLDVFDFPLANRDKIREVLASFDVLGFYITPSADYLSVKLYSGDAMPLAGVCDFC